MKVASIFGVLLTAGCVEGPTIVRPHPPENRPVHVSETLSAADVRLVTHLIEQTQAIVSSAQFARHVDHSVLGWLGTPTSSESLSGTDVLLAYTGAAEKFRLPEIIGYQAHSWFWGCLWETADTEINPANGNATIKLQGCTMTRAAEKNEPFACAINTMAHEWTHTISRSDSNAGYVFQDGEYTAGLPLVSYHLGAVAQCTYLEVQGMIDSSRFDDCVKAVVGPPLDSATCAPGWAARFRTSGGT